MSEVLQGIIDQLPGIRERLMGMREILLANLVMLGETPAPTFREDRRIKLLQDRFIMSGLDNTSTDEMGSGYGILPGSEQHEKHILVVAHADSVLDESADHTVTVQPNEVIGPALGDNAFGVAVLASLPSMLEALEITFEHNIILMGAARSLGRGNLGGLQFFLDNPERKVGWGVCLDAVELGRISYHSIGMTRGEVRVTVPKEYDWTRFGIMGAIVTLNEVIAKINEIPLPRKPQTVVVLGSVSAGKGYNVIATKAVLRFEIRSESAEMVEEVWRRIEDICAEVASMSQAEVRLESMARRHPGGIDFSHPMARTARELIRAVGLETRISPSSSELAALTEREISAIAMGLTLGHDVDETIDALQIAPMFQGVTNLIGLLLAIDRGCCDHA